MTVTTPTEKCIVQIVVSLVYRCCSVRRPKFETWKQGRDASVIYKTPHYLFLGECGADTALQQEQLLPQKQPHLVGLECSLSTACTVDFCK